MADAKKIPLAAQIRCVERELNYRRSVYPRWVQSQRMKQDEADYQLAAMEAVLATLKEKCDTQTTMFEP